MSALWTSDEVAHALGATIAVPFKATGVTFDSRAVGTGDLFFALKGETTDVHGFVADAMKRGAAAAVVSRTVENAGGTLIRVPDTLKALEGLGRAARGRSKARIASVTGSMRSATPAPRAGPERGTRVTVAAVLPSGGA